MTQEGEVWNVPFSSDWKQLVSSGCDQYEATGNEDEYPACIAGSARVWKVFTAQEIAPIDYNGEVGNAIFSPDGQWVVSGSEDGIASVWEAVTGKEISRMPRDPAADEQPDGIRVGTVPARLALSEHLPKFTPTIGIKIIDERWIAVLRRISNSTGR